MADTPGQDAALFLAGVMVLSGALLGLLGHGRKSVSKPEAAEFELASLALTSFGTALGLWSLAGRGWGLLLTGLGIFLGVSLFIFGRRAIAKGKPQTEDDKAQQGECPRGRKELSDSDLS